VTAYLRPKFAATNNGLLYTAKGTASLLIPLASVLKASSGSWVPVLWIAGTLPIAAAVLAIFVLSQCAGRCSTNGGRPVRKDV